MYQRESSYYLFKRLFSECIKKYSLKLILAIIFMVIVAAANATHAWMIKPVLDDIFVKQDLSMLKIIPIIVVFISIIKAICTYFQNFYVKYLGQRVIIDIQSKLYTHLIHSDLEYINNVSSGTLISRFTNDISLLKNTMTNFLTSIAKELFTLIFLLGVMVSLSTTLSFITFIVFPLAIFPIIRMGRRMRRISTKTQEELGNYTAKLDDTFQTVKIVKSFRREEFEVQKAKTILESIFNLYIKAIKTEVLSSPLMEILSGITIAAVIWYGGIEVFAGHTSPGTFFAFIGTFIAAYKPIKCIADLNNNLQEGLAAAQRLFSVLDTKAKILNKDDATKLEIKEASISFDDIVFKHNNSKFSLSSMSLDIEAGKTVAFVGKSGSGKSTLLNLLLRFYDIDSGKILVGGQDISDITISSLRENISYVSQEVMLFDNDILANIEYGKQNATREEIEDAAKIADAHEFIMLLPNQYETKIGQHGHKLSGGQKQKISIARAVLKNAPILILDEATSALDNISEKKIFTNLKKIRQDKTNIIVAHRLSTIIDADVIFVFKKGSIVEKGSHKSLLAQKKEYSKLYHADQEHEA